MNKPKLKSATITYCGDSRMFEVGNNFVMDVPDQRRWKRFLHWICFMRPPKVRKHFTVTNILSNTSVNIEPNSGPTRAKRPF
jgi:hypothetical protein